MSLNIMLIFDIVIRDIPTTLRKILEYDFVGKITLQYSGFVSYIKFTFNSHIK